MIWTVGTFLLLGSVCSAQSISLSSTSLEENLPHHTFIGVFFPDSILQLQGPGDVILDQSWEHNRYFFLQRDSLFSLQSFNHEKDSLFQIRVTYRPDRGEEFTQVMDIHILDIEGKFDENGFADSELAARFPNVREGDYVLLEPNVDHEHLFLGNGLPAISFPARIWIRGDEYGVILLALDSVEGNSPDERIIISNLEGQIRANKVQLIGGSYWRLTGQFDPEDGIGDERYPGCEKNGSSVDFGFSAGTYGWDIRNAYTSDEIGLQIYGEATGFEVDHLEISDGGFAGLMMKSEDSNSDMNDVYLHHLYIHDVGGEGMYLGSTNPDPQHQLNRLKVEFCNIMRSGAEGIQAGQLGPGCEIRNNVMWGGMHWMSPFNIYQDHGMQIAIRNGGSVIENNIILASGNAFFNVKMTPHAVDPPNADSLILRNNLGYLCRGPFAAYMSEESDLVTPVLWRGNYFAEFQYNYDRVYLTRPWVEPAIRIASKTITIIFRDNVIDKTKSQMFELWNNGDATVVDLGSHRSDLPPLSFRNLAGEYDNYLDWYFYFDEVGEHPDFPEKNTLKGTPIIYKPGDIVGVPVDGDTRFFKCLNTISSMSPLVDSTDSWQLLYWVYEGDTTYNPPDDVRLQEENFYSLKSMGVEPNEEGPSPLILSDEDPEPQGIEVLPNPSQGAIRIYAPSERGSVVRLFSGEGSLLASEETDQSGQAEFDLSSYPMGVYLISVSSSTGQMTRKVLRN